MNRILAAQLAALSTAQAGGPLLWSNPATWGGQVPQAGDTVTIAPGVSITLDTTTNTLAALQVSGDLVISSSADSWLKTNQMQVTSGGRVISGTWSNGAVPQPLVANPRKHRRTMTGPSKAGTVKGFTHTGDAPTGNNGTTNDDSGIRRGLLVMDGGQYLINAARPAILKAHLTAHARTSATSLTLDVGVYWKAGDEIVIGPTDFKTALYAQQSRTERRVVATDTNGSNVVSLTVALTYDHWGLLQYPRDDKTISLTPGAFTTGAGGMRATALTPAVIDQRAMVMNLTRSHVVEGDADAELANNGFGAHEMYMGLGSVTNVKGVQYKNCGQAGLLGRYPIHFHLNAYKPDGTTKTNPKTGLADGNFAPGQAVIEDCSVMDSNNRLHSVHGAKGVLFKNIVGDNISGSAYFMENGSEVNNTWDSCHVFRVKAPAAGLQLQAFDSSPSGWWITNNDNEFINTVFDKNGAAECDGIGVQILMSRDRAGYPGGCFGSTAQVPLHPFYTPTRAWTGFKSHSNGSFNLAAAGGIIDEQGNLTQGPFQTNVNSTKGPIAGGDYSETAMTLKLVGDELWKGEAGNYLNNQRQPLYLQRVVADGKYSDFTGNTILGEIEDTLFVEKSQNVWCGPLVGNGSRREGMISYHGSIVARNCSVFGYHTGGQPMVDTVPYPNRFIRKMVTQSFLGAEDTYLFPVIYYTDHMYNMRFTETTLNSYQPPQPYLQGRAPFAQFSQGAVALQPGLGSVAIWDKDGFLFNRGADKFILADHPSVTYGCANLASVTNSAGQYMGMVETTSSIVGGNRDYTGTLYSDGTSADSQPIAARCVNPVDLSDAPDPEAYYDMTVTPSNAVEAKYCYVTAPSGGAVRFYHPTDSTKKWKKQFWIFEAARGRPADFSIILGIPWANGDPSPVSGYGSVTTGAASKAAFLASSGNAFWRDTTAQIVWFRLCGVGFKLDNYTNAQGTLFRAYTQWRAEYQLG